MSNKQTRPNRTSMVTAAQTFSPSNGKAEVGKSLEFEDSKDMRNPVSNPVGAGTTTTTKVSSCLSKIMSESLPLFKAVRVSFRHC